VLENVSAFDADLTRAQVESIAAAGQIDPVLSGAPDFLAAGQPSVARAASNCRRAGA
jgi:hypothetical protein